MATVVDSQTKLKKNKRKSLNLWPALFVGPHLLLFVLFFLIPSVYGFYIAFTKWDIFTSPEFVGFENFKTILFDQDSSFYSQFWNGLKNTFIFVVITVPFCIIVPLVLATALMTKPKLYGLFQSIFYLPTLFAISAVMIIWQFLMSLSYGPFSNVFGFDVNMLSTQPYAWIVLVVVTVWWSIGGNMVIYLAALNGVPKDLLEAAEMDGAGVFRKFFKITLPSIKFQILFTTVMTTIAQFNVYGQPLMLTGGGPTDSTRVLLMDIQQNAFGKGISIAGISSAMAVMLGLCIMVVSVFQFLLLRDKD
ncbi:carbohydrate ABC transporter permease [Ornithinibacillus contaminans]|uniref:carbohydrate ABC transporter permease n=1 Tax=Ornithinibacillus contaminans TaxID=694055 RepID=UPI00064DDD08|nr:sugar ABC transporter permease [Ornithinibacillus contaminans]